MNSFSLQLNLLPDKLKGKLPPTDSRLRGDIRAWENGDEGLASKEKERLEKIQRSRRQELKKLLPEVDQNNEQSYHRPQFFEKEEYKNEKGVTEYIFKNKDNLYWQLREKGDWSQVPRIYEED